MTFPTAAAITTLRKFFGTSVAIAVLLVEKKLLSKPVGVVEFSDGSPDNPRDANRQYVMSSSPWCQAAQAIRKQKAPPKRGFRSRPRKGVTGRTSFPLLRNLPGACSARSALHIHAFHSAHSTHAVSMASGILLLFDQLSHHRLGGEQQPGDGCRVLQRGAAHLGRIEHAHFDHITKLLGLGVEAEVALALRDLVHHDRRLCAGVGDDLAERLL